jgi:hypothetical protein
VVVERAVGPRLLLELDQFGAHRVRIAS